MAAAAAAAADRTMASAGVAGKTKSLASEAAGLFAAARPDESSAVVPTAGQHSGAAKFHVRHRRA